MSARNKQNIRPLTNDEKKAAEAAFRGVPFNPKWSEAARKVYQGISGALAAKPSQILSQLGAGSQATTPQAAMVESKARTRTRTKI